MSEDAREFYKQIVTEGMVINWKNYVFVTESYNTDNWAEHSVCGEKLPDDWSNVFDLIVIILEHEAQCYIKSRQKVELRKGLKNIQDG